MQFVLPVKSLDTPSLSYSWLFFTPIYSEGVKTVNENMLNCVVNKESGKLTEMHFIFEVLENSRHPSQKKYSRIEHFFPPLRYYCIYPANVFDVLSTYLLRRK